MDQPTATTAQQSIPADPMARSKPTSASSHATRNRLVRLAFRFVWNLDDAEDIAQDALATAHEQRGTLRDDEKWWTWICRILVHRCHEHGRRELRRQHHEPALWAESIRRSKDYEKSGEGDRADWLQRFIGELPRRQREVIVLRHLQGMSYGQVAAILGVKPATARVHAQAAREALREMILRRHPKWFQIDGEQADHP